MAFMARTAESRRARIAAENPEIAADLAEVVVDPPDRTFARRPTWTSADGGSSSVSSAAVIRTTTSSILVPDAAVLFAGDLLEGGAVPFFGDAYPLDWPETAFRVAELPFGVVVPGHGDHAGRRFADEQAAAIAEVALLARRVRDGDLGLDEAVARSPFPDYPAEDVRKPLQRALAQLRGESSLATPGRRAPRLNNSSRTHAIPYEHDHSGRAVAEAKRGPARSRRAGQGGRS